MFVSKQETGNATGCLSENLCPKVGENPEMLCRSCRSCRCCGGVGRSIICRPVWRKTHSAPSPQLLGVGRRLSVSSSRGLSCSTVCELFWGMLGTIICTAVLICMLVCMRVAFSSAAFRNIITWYVNEHVWFFCACVFVFGGCPGSSQIEQKN